MGEVDYLHHLRLFLTHWQSLNPSEQQMKAQYYPRLDKKDLFALGYISERSGHTRGSTVDLTLIHAPKGRPQPARSKAPPAGWLGVWDPVHEGGRSSLLLRSLFPRRLGRYRCGYG